MIGNVPRANLQRPQRCFFFEKLGLTLLDVSKVQTVLEICRENMRIVAKRTNNVPYERKKKSNAPYMEKTE